MLTDFERQQCRDFKKRLDAARTPEGLKAIKIAAQVRQAQDNVEKVRQHYKKQSVPAELPKNGAKRNGCRTDFKIL